MREDGRSLVASNTYLVMEDFLVYLVYDLAEAGRHAIQASEFKLISAASCHTFSGSIGRRAGAKDRAISRRNNHAFQLTEPPPRYHHRKHRHTSPSDFHLCLKHPSSLAALVGSPEITSRCSISCSIVKFINDWEWLVYGTSILAVQLPRAP